MSEKSIHLHTGNPLLQASVKPSTRSSGVANSERMESAQHLSTRHPSPAQHGQSSLMSPTQPKPNSPSQPCLPSETELATRLFQLLRLAQNFHHLFLGSC